MARHSLTLSQAEGTERYGLEVNLLSPASLDAYQLIMSRPGASVVNSGAIREEVEVML